MTRSKTGEKDVEVVKLFVCQAEEFSFYPKVMRYHGRIQFDSDR